MSALEEWRTVEDLNTSTNFGGALNPNNMSSTVKNNRKIVYKKKV
jgi:hypothetical protein